MEAPVRILYVAKHGEHDNQDEMAIAHALGVLGHEVVRVHEMRRHRRHNAGVFDELPPSAPLSSYDFCLFHKWETVSEIQEVAAVMPCAFWYFDLISNDDDPTLRERMARRRRWFDDVIPHCVTAFLTDGDWVNRWNGRRVREDHRVGGEFRPGDGKMIHWLMQGADERNVGYGVPRFTSTPEILFTGTRYHGTKRAEHIDRLQTRYGSRFGVVGENQRQSPRRHGRELADLFASCKVVVAPDGPCTDRYWSNRVYLTAGFGGYLIHPLCKGLEPHYNTAELRQYRDRDELERMIDYALECSSEIPTMRMFGLHATQQRNLYRHRCEVLVNTMRGLI